jgi:hypothetical protein
MGQEFDEAGDYQQLLATRMIAVRNLTEPQSWPEHLQDICVDRFETSHGFGDQAIARSWIF